MTWNIANNDFDLFSSRFGVAVSDNRVFIAPSASDQLLQSFDVVTGTVTSLAQMPTNQAGTGAFCADRNGTLYLLYSEFKYLCVWYLKKEQNYISTEYSHNENYSN